MVDFSQSDAQTHIAEEIKRLRRDQGRSLQELAAKSGVSRSMISKIERAETTASTAILSRLAEALGVTFSRLVSPITEREVIIIPASRQPVLKDDSSGFMRRCISPVLPGRGIDWVLNTLPPGATTGEFAAHRPGVSEYIYVLRGSLKAVIGGRSNHLEAGDSMYFEADAGHQFYNTGSVPCEYFLVIDPSRLR